MREPRIFGEYIRESGKKLVITWVCSEDEAPKKATREGREWRVMEALQDPLRKNFTIAVYR